MVRWQRLVRGGFSGLGDVMNVDFGSVGERLAHVLSTHVVDTLSSRSTRGQIKTAESYLRIPDRRYRVFGILGLEMSH